MEKDVFSQTKKIQEILNYSWYLFVLKVLSHTRSGQKKNRSNIHRKREKRGDVREKNEEKKDYDGYFVKRLKSARTLLLREFTTVHAKA